mmetsp:Transcript_19847/g.55130  ORF Transcript_19847/g.55130 Transcript_19847/m.55130 type:complete len:90 (-) Transcript_19847:158-427(-)
MISKSFQKNGEYSSQALGYEARLLPIQRNVATFLRNSSLRLHRLDSNLPGAIESGLLEQVHLNTLDYQLEAKDACTQIQVSIGELLPNF